MTQSPSHVLEVCSCMRNILGKNISVVDFTAWQLMKVLRRDLCVFYVCVVSLRVRMCLYFHVCEDTATAFWINKQELAFICHSTIRLL